MKRIRNLVIVVAGLAAVIAIAAFVNRGNGGTSVTARKIAFTTFTVKLPETAVLQRPHTETVPALVAGNIAHIYVRAGDRVVAGELLATLYNPTLDYTAAGSRADYFSASANIDLARVQERNARVSYEAAVETAKSNLDLARQTYNADATLYANQAIPRLQLNQDKSKLDQAQVAYEQAVAQLKLGAVTSFNGDSVQAAAAAQKARILNDQNQQQLAFTRIFAPSDGVVQTVAAQPNDPLRPLQPGDAIMAGEALFTIADGSAFIVRTKVDEQDIAQVQLGQEAIVSGEDFGGANFAGHVAAIAPTAQKSDDPSATTKQVLTVIALDKIARFMKDGMSADVDILTTNLHHVLAVPTTSIVSKKGQHYVWVVSGGKVTKRPVTLGKSNDTESVVRGGLQAGEFVVERPAATLRNGIAVTIETPGPSPAPAGS